MLGEISRKTLPRYQILFIQIYDISIKVLLHLDIKTRIKFCTHYHSCPGAILFEKSFMIMHIFDTVNVKLLFSETVLPSQHFDFCLELQTPCSKNPCLNEGKCINFKDTFQCVCKNGYNGSTCEGALSPEIMRQFNQAKPKTVNYSKELNFFPLRFIFKQR